MDEQEAYLSACGLIDGSFDDETEAGAAVEACLASESEAVQRIGKAAARKLADARTPRVETAALMVSRHGVTIPAAAAVMRVSIAEIRVALGMDRDLRSDR